MADVHPAALGLVHKSRRRSCHTQLMGAARRLRQVVANGESTGQMSTEGKARRHASTSCWKLLPWGDNTLQGSDHITQPRMCSPADPVWPPRMRSRSLALAANEQSWPSRCQHQRRQIARIGRPRIQRFPRLGKVRYRRMGGSTTCPDPCHRRAR